MSASSILAAWVLTHMTQLGARLHRNNVGEAWAGKGVTQKDGSVKIKAPSRVKYGLCVGSSDHIGWTPVIVGPEHVGQTVAVFTAVEEKTLAYPRLTADQANWLTQVTAAGGLGYVARETADGPLLNRWPEPVSPSSKSKKKKT